MSKRISVEQIEKHCSTKKDQTQVRVSPQLRIIKNIESNIDKVVSICGSTAQLYIEENIQHWNKGAFHLTEVRYRQGDDESMLLFNFRPNNCLGNIPPRVLVIFKRTGIDSDNEGCLVEQFYIPFNDSDGKVPEVYYGSGENVSSYFLEDRGTPGFAIYTEAITIEKELSDLNS